MIRTDFLNQIISVKDIDKDIPYEKTLLDNEEKQIQNISEFLQNEKKLLIINGFKGTGKSSISDFVLSCLKPEVITIKYRCFETTILDDMLLAFFDIFRQYSMKGIIVPPKIKVDNFAQKINSYFNHIAAPIVVVIDSFDTVLKDNKPDILNFIRHLTHLTNIKIILISRKYFPEDFKDIDCDNTTLLAYTKDNFEKFLKSNSIKQIGVLSNELYKQTKGYYNNIKMSVNIMKMRSYSIGNFLEAFSKSFITFSDFITREKLSAVDPVSVHLFRLLAMMRIPIHINLLKSLHLYNQERENFFIQNSILQQDGETLYLDEDLRDFVEHQIPDNVAQKLHKSCIDLYNTQLPLKPLERDLKLSRQTMRNEIDYHSLFLPRRQFIPSANPIEVKIPESNVITSEILPPEESKEDKFKKINFIIEDEALLDNIADSIKDFVSQKDEIQEMQERSSGLGVTKLVNLARQQESKYNYKHAIMLYQNALTKRDDPDFLKLLPNIYTSLGEDYSNLSRWYEALEYYTQAQDFYYNTSNKEKAAEIKLEIARIYGIIYKHDNAKFILSELEKDKTLSGELQIKIILALGEISDKKRAHEYYERGIGLLSNNIVSKPVRAELYYKFAASCDEMDETKTAILYYKKCLDVEPDLRNNKYASLAMSNLAEIYDEAGAITMAEKYYQESINIDKAAKNYNGLYISARNLAQMYTKNPQKSLEWLERAYIYAQELNEPYYITDSALELGNFYLLRKNYENAYKYFIKAYNTDNKVNAADVLPKIEQIKHIIGEKEFLKLEEKYD